MGGDARRGQEDVARLFREGVWGWGGDCLALVRGLLPLWKERSGVRLLGTRSAGGARHVRVVGYDLVEGSSLFLAAGRRLQDGAERRVERAVVLELGHLLGCKQLGGQNGVVALVQVDELEKGRK